MGWRQLSASSPCLADAATKRRTLPQRKRPLPFLVAGIPTSTNARCSKTPRGTVVALVGLEPAARWADRARRQRLLLKRGGRPFGAGLFFFAGRTQGSEAGRPAERLGMESPGSGRSSIATWQGTGGRPVGRPETAGRPVGTGGRSEAISAGVLARACRCKPPAADPGRPEAGCGVRYPGCGTP